jgi:hypothetical protein
MILLCGGRLAMISSMVGASLFSVPLKSESKVSRLLGRRAERSNLGARVLLLGALLLSHPRRAVAIIAMTSARSNLLTKSRWATRRRLMR